MTIAATPTLPAAANAHLVVFTAEEALTRFCHRTGAAVQLSLKVQVTDTCATTAELSQGFFKQEKQL